MIQDLITNFFQGRIPFSHFSTSIFLDQINVTHRRVNWRVKACKSLKVRKALILFGRIVFALSNKDVTKNLSELKDAFSRRNVFEQLSFKLRPGVGIQAAVDSGSIDRNILIIIFAKKLLIHDMLFLIACFVKIKDTYRLWVICWEYFNTGILRICHNGFF